MSETKLSKKLLVCDVEGTIFKAEFKITGTDYASTMWQPLAHKLDKYNEEHDIRFEKTTELEEKESNDEWEKREHGKYKGKYLLWVEDTVRIHKEHCMNKTVFDDVLNSAVYQNGVKEFFENIDTEKYIPVLISGGFQELAERAQRELTDKDGNTIITHSFAACKYIWGDDGKLKAWNMQPTDFKNKYAFLKLILDQYGLSETSDWIFVGDGKNDADIASRAPVSFAITPHPELAAVSTYTIESFSEINELLDSDEIARGLSKKRGLSNKQSVLVGQRLINAGLIEQPSYTDNFKSSEAKVKFRFKATMESNDGTPLFKKAFDKIIEWCCHYADDSARFNAEISECVQRKRFDYLYDGIAKISIACINSEEKRLGIEIHSQDTGTELRQAVLGAKTEIHIDVSKNLYSGSKLDMSVYIVTRTPDNSFIKKNNIPLEAYCPAFIKSLCDENISIYIDGNKRLSKNFENVKYEAALTILNDRERTIPVVFVDEKYNNDNEVTGLKPLLSYVFGFAKVYACKSSVLEKLVRYSGEAAETAGVMVSFLNEKPIVFSKSVVEKPTSDAISYESNSRKLYSKNDGCKTSAINISDLIIAEYKKSIEAIEWKAEASYYNQVSDMVWKLETDEAIIQGKKKSAEDIIAASKAVIGKSSIDIARIEAVEQRITSDLSRQGRNSHIALLSGVRKFLEKGELLLLLHKDTNSGNSPEKYPMSLLQPIACAFEICVNIWLYTLIGEDYFDVKKEFKECGRLIGYMQNNGLISGDYNTNQVLKAALDCRNNSSHPNEMRLLNSIMGSEKDKLYKAIAFISKKL